MKPLALIVSVFLLLSVSAVIAQEIFNPSGDVTSGTFASPIITGSTTLTSLTAKTFVFLDAGKVLTSTTAPTNGQLLIGSTGNVPAVGSLTGSSNILVTPGAGSISLDTAQDIQTGSSPTFNGLTLSTATIGTAGITTANVTTANITTETTTTAGITTANITTGNLTTANTTTENVTNLVSGGGTAITKIVVYSQTVTPASVNAATCAEQTFTVTGLTTADKVFVNPAATGNSTSATQHRVSASDTLASTFCNVTAGSLTPGSGTWKIVAVRS